MKTKEELLKEKTHDFESLCSVMECLRAPDGCPWDKEQTHKSVRRCLIEETYEVCEAIDKNDPVLMREELGDLMFQAVFHAQIEKEAGNFDIDGVVNDITEKMIRRHPHVFGDTVAETGEEVLRNWDSIKKEEKHIETPADALRRCPPGLPALLKAQKVQGKALSRYNRGFSDEGQALNSAALAIEALSRPDAEKNGLRSQLLSDALFALCAAAQMWGEDAEAGLDSKTESFIKSFE